MYSVEITRFSSRQALIRQLKRLCTLLKLQGSQAKYVGAAYRSALCTLLKLQGSQAGGRSVCFKYMLCTLLKLQGSQAPIG